MWSSNVPGNAFLALPVPWKYGLMEQQSRWAAVLWTILKWCSGETLEREMTLWALEELILSIWMYQIEQNWINQVLKPCRKNCLNQSGFGSVCMSKILSFYFQLLVFCWGEVSGTSCWILWVGVTPSKPLVFSLSRADRKPVQFFCCLFLTRAVLDVKLGQCSVCCHILVRKMEFRKVHSCKTVWCLGHLSFYHTILYACFCSEIELISLSCLTHQVV